MSKEKLTKKENEILLKIYEKKLSRMCAVCKKELLEDSPASTLTITAKIDMTKFRGLFFPLQLLNKDIIPAFVVPEQSQAFEDGYDMVVICCSNKCATKLKTILNKEMFTMKQIEDANKKD